MSDKREWIEIIETKSDLIERRKQLFDFRYCDLFRIPVYGEVGTAVKPIFLLFLKKVIDAFLKISACNVTIIAF